MLKYYIEVRRLHPKTAISCNLFYIQRTFLEILWGNPVDIIFG
jgi:hypothetical protein